MAEFVSPFHDLGKKPIEVHGQMQCFDCYDEVDTGTYDKHKQTLTFECVNGHVNRLENYKI